MTIVSFKICLQIWDSKKSYVSHDWYSVQHLKKKAPLNLIKQDTMAKTSNVTIYFFYTFC